MLLCDILLEIADYYPDPDPDQPVLMRSYTWDMQYTASQTGDAGLEVCTCSLRGMFWRRQDLVRGRAQNRENI